MVPRISLPPSLAFLSPPFSYDSWCGVEGQLVLLFIEHLGFQL